MAVLIQKYVTCDFKEPVKLREGGAAAAAIMEFWTLEGYAVGFLIGVAAVLVGIIIRDDKGSGSVLLGDSFEDDCDGNIEGVSPGEGDPLGVS